MMLSTLLYIIWPRCKAVANVNTLKDPRAATFLSSVCCSYGIRAAACVPAAAVPPDPQIQNGIVREGVWNFRLE